MLHLPTILLGLRTTYKEDLKATPAELVYGTSLQLPGEFFDEHQSYRNETETVTDLRKDMAQLRPTNTSWHNKDRIFVHAELRTATHVFVRNDSVRPSLTLPYNGPYEVVERSPNYFKLRIGTHMKNVSIDRLKPAFTTTSNENNASLPIRRRTTNQPMQPEPKNIPRQLNTSTTTATIAPEQLSTKVTRTERKVRFPPEFINDVLSSKPGVLWPI